MSSNTLASLVPPKLRLCIADAFTPKRLDDMKADSSETAVKRSLGFFELTLIGMGCIMGAGIFVLTGQVAGNHAGPAIVISYLIAGLCASLAALCYSEMASMIPVPGSAYSYSYATVGEFLAWIIGWNLILEYLVATGAVSVGWSAYVVSFVKDLGGGGLIRDEWINAPFAWNETSNSFYLTGKFLNVPAIIIVVLLTFLLIAGIKESALFNGVTVVIKVIVVLIFVFASIKWIKPENWQPFVPPEQSWGHFGVSGILQATTMVFFTYVGFDAVCTTAQECRNPQRDMPIGIMTSLIICTTLYIAVAICLTGLIPHTELVGVASPIATAASYIGQRWLAIVTEVGAIAGSTSVMTVNLVSQPRIFYAMARDGLFPSWIGYVHPKLGTPVVSTCITGVTAAVLGGLLPIGILSELTSVGTLCAFVLVSLSVMILRRTRPDLPRKFKVPFGPYVIPSLSICCSITLLVWSTTQAKIRLVVWVGVGIILYIVYGRRHSKFQRRLREKRMHEFILNSGRRWITVSDKDGFNYAIETGDEDFLKKVKDLRSERF